MSGPKVVRIVTREEVVAICQGLLAQLRDAVRQWEKVGQRNDLLSNDEIEGTRKRLQHIEASLAQDRFLELQKDVPTEIEFLKSDMVKRLEEAAKKAADGRVRRRRIAMFAGQKLEEANRSALALPQELRRKLEEIASGDIDDTRAEAALAEALALSIGQEKRPAVSAEQQKLADRLRGSETTSTLADWLQRHPSEAEEANVKVDAAIAELQFAGASAEAAAFAARQQSILKEGVPARQRMLADTLILDISKAAAERREVTKQLSLLSEQAAQLAAIDSPAARSLAARAESIVAREDAAGASKLVSEIREFIAAERKVLAAAAQRRAIMSTLAELGYEVREGMNTASAKDGRLFMRRAANPEMGVEVAVAAGTERLQFRPVRFGAAGAKSDRGRDRDIETLWCSDFDKLHKRLKAEKGELVIEKALPVGAVEVLFVAEDDAAQSRRPDVVAPLKTRST